LDAYLEIAWNVLKEARVPLPPRQILKAALENDLIPSKLYGKTQHKTLQARLSEDILSHRERSAFFRTQPGYFFLREFITDSSIPTEYRTPIVARRRRRELAYPSALAFDRRTISEACGQLVVKPEAVLDLIRSQRHHYASSSKERKPDDVLVWAFTLVLRDNFILTYRHGKYREDRDSFLQKRSIGFFSPVVENDLTLFDQADHGIVASSMRTLSFDLNLPYESELAGRANLRSFVCATADDPPNLLGLVSFDTPEWFEPLTRRLAINDLSWHDMNLTINHFEDFDPWSRLVLSHAQKVFGLGLAESSANEASCQ
jgi:hypothetical protein